MAILSISPAVDYDQYGPAKPGGRIPEGDRRQATRIARSSRVAGNHLKGKTAMLSARNQLPAVVKSVKVGNVMAEVVMEVAGVEIVSAITRGSAEALKLQPGDRVTAIIKATEVIVDKA
jgi:molybdopterin-binding protein